MIPETDLLFLREAVNDLREYILAKDLYWPLRSKARKPGGVQLPQLTIGNLTFAQARLAAFRLQTEQAKELESISARIQQVRQEWLSNWRLKEEREFASRLNLWQQYLRELRSEPRQHAPFFAREVRNRVILDLLLAGDPGKNLENQEEQLRMLDQILRGISQPGPLLWEADLEPAFPQEKYWFLYVTFPTR